MSVPDGDPAAVRSDPAAVWVVHDGVFAKKGRHSVGVQRQFARSVGKKINCQVGVFVAQIGPAGYFPLAARLYLPASWLRENTEAAEKALPLSDRDPATKAGIALRLIDELRAEGVSPLAVTGEAGYLTAPDFRDGLAARDGDRLDRPLVDQGQAAEDYRHGHRTSVRLAGCSTPGYSAKERGQT